jgi:hypothetical protein
MFGFIKKILNKDDEYDRAKEALISGMFERSENWQAKGSEIAVDCYENGLKDGALIRFTQILDLIETNYPNNIGPIENGFLTQMNKYIDSGEVVNVSIEGDELNFIHKEHLKNLMES